MSHRRYANKLTILSASMLLLLTVGTAGAENLPITVISCPPNPMEVCDPDGVPLTKTQVRQYWRQLNEPDPCLAKMEAALKAIEPWIGYTYKDDTNPADFKRAKALYYETKRDCWTK